LHRSSVLSFSRDGLARIAGDVRLLAEKEGLTAHAASVAVRLAESNHDARGETGRSPSASRPSGERGRG
jgi:histidinol dehydrogenase